MFCYDRDSLTMEWPVDRLRLALTTRTSARTPCALGIQKGYYYGCHCREGFRGDGYVDCQGDRSWPFNLTFILLLCINLVIPKHDGKFLLINHGMSILRMPSMSGRRIFVQNFQAAVGKINNYIIYEIGGFIFTPEGIAIDWALRNVYWTDSMRDTVELANLESIVRRVLFNTNVKYLFLF